MVIAKKRPAKRPASTVAAANKVAISTPAAPAVGTNPFEKGTPAYKVAALLVKRGDHSWDEMKAAADGVLSPRTVGSVLRGLEAAGFRFTKRRDAEFGTVYTLDKTGKAEMLSNVSGSDATGKRVARKAAAPKADAPAKRTPKSRPGKKAATPRRGGSVTTSTATPATTKVAKKRPAVKKRSVRK